MSYRRVLILIGLGIALLQACSSGQPRSLVLAEPREIGKVLRVTPTLEWSRFHDRILRAELWTINGPRLDALRFYYGIRKDGTLLQTYGSNTLPSYRPGMTEHEIMELVASTFTRSGMSQVATRDLRPFQFGKLDGFRFEMDYVSSQGLEYQALAAGAQDPDNERLYLVLFTAAAAHYAPTYLPEVERILASLETL